MVYLSKVTSRGQITLPQEMRDEEGITQEDYVVVRKVGRSIVVSKAQLALDDITTSFETEAHKKNITKEELLDELEKVRANRRK